MIVYRMQHLFTWISAFLPKRQFGNQVIVRTEIMTKHQVDKSDDKVPLFANAGFK